MVCEPRSGPSSFLHSCCVATFSAANNSQNSTLALLSWVLRNSWLERKPSVSRSPLSMLSTIPGSVALVLLLLMMFEHLLRTRRSPCAALAQARAARGRPQLCGGAAMTFIGRAMCTATMRMAVGRPRSLLLGGPAGVVLEEADVAVDHHVVLSLRPVLSRGLHRGLAPRLCDSGRELMSDEREREREARPLRAEADVRAADP